MARILNMVLFSALATVAMLQSSAVATTYFVGDSSNWIIPSSSNFYSNWAANKDFKVGDILVFNFLQNQHDVAEVTKANYDACNGANPISSHTSSPTNITLQKTGEHYYICTFGSGGHCQGGQKLAINVTGASSPAPQPSSPSPSPVPARAPAPRPSSPSPVPPPASSPTPSAPSPSTTSPPPSSNPASPPSTTSPPSGTPVTPSPDSTTTPPPSPTTGATPPDNSGASSLTVAGLSATTFFSIMALALWN